MINCVQIHQMDSITILPSLSHGANQPKMSASSSRYFETISMHALMTYEFFTRDSMNLIRSLVDKISVFSITFHIFIE